MYTVQHYIDNMMSNLGEISIGRFTIKKYYHLVMKTQWMEMFIHHIEEPGFVLLKFFSLKILIIFKIIYLGIIFGTSGI